MVQTIIMSFFAGLFAANGTPHFVKGITKERFPTTFGSGPLVNLLAGWASYVIAGLLAWGAGVGERPVAAFAAAAAGALAIGVFHATVGAFGERPAARA